MTRKYTNWTDEMKAVVLRFAESNSKIKWKLCAHVLNTSHGAMVKADDCKMAYSRFMKAADEN